MWSALEVMVLVFKVWRANDVVVSSISDLTLGIDPADLTLTAFMLHLRSVASTNKGYDAMIATPRQWQRN